MLNYKTPTQQMAVAVWLFVIKIVVKLLTQIALRFNELSCCFGC